MLRVILLAAAVFSSFEAAQGAIINGDFETGDLTGWLDWSDPSATVKFQAGPWGQMVLLDAGGETDARSGRAWITQEFDVDKPMWFSFDYKAILYGGRPGDGAALHLFLSGASQNLYSKFIVPGELVEIPWTTIPTLLSPGHHIIDLVSARSLGGPWGEGAAYALVYVDNVRLTPVPEPSTFALAALGLVALGWAAIFKSR